MGDVKKLAVIGDPIAHSLSPLLHNAMARELGLPYAYEAVLVKLETLPEWVRRVREEPFAGFNVTMPHKLGLLALVDRLTPEASEMGAVNSVRNDGGILTGHNTDGSGFASSLEEHGLQFAGANVTVLGAGGAAGAIVRRAASDGAARITVMNRTLPKAQALCEGLRGAAALPLDAPVPEDTDLLVNTVPVGNNLDVSFVKNLSKQCAVFDILYAPPQTPLLRAAEARGLLAVNGLGMLIHQAIDAFSFFTGAEMDHREMAAILRRALQKC